MDIIILSQEIKRNEKIKLTMKIGVISFDDLSTLINSLNNLNKKLSEIILKE